MNALDRVNEKLVGTMGIAIAPVRAAVLGAATYLIQAGTEAAQQAADAAQVAAVDLATTAGHAVASGAATAATPEGSAAISELLGVPFLAPVVAALAVGIRRIK